jgi:GAF domain-containing protein
MADETARIARLEAENAGLRAQNAALTIERDEAVERQSATSDILRIIASLSGDPEPVLDAVARTAMRLVRSENVQIALIEGDRYRVIFGIGEGFPLRVGESSSLARRTPMRVAVRERRTIHIPDRTDPAYRAAYPDGPVAPIATIQVPLVRDREVMGMISMLRDAKEPYCQDEIALLETFADQAMIAIENTRLFQELTVSNRQLTETVARQTAMAEILGTMASSPTDSQPVLIAIVERARELSHSTTAAIALRDGDCLRSAAGVGILAPILDGHVATLDQRRTSVRALIEQRTIHIADQSDPAVLAEYPDNANREPAASVTVPLVREQAPIGVLMVLRDRATPFSPDEIGLIEAFADQAVIAIENARLFSQLERRNSDLQDRTTELAEALEQQTATSEILRVIATSPTDAQPVLDAIAESAARLTRSVGGSVSFLEGRSCELPRGGAPAC